MKDTLFPKIRLEDFLLDVEYQGPSFLGKMEINHLGREILGMEDCLKIIIQILSKYKKINFNINDVEIFVETFQEGSFRKRIQITLKTLEKYPVTYMAIVTLFVGVLIAIPQYRADKIREMSPELMTQIKDQIKIELLKDKQFLKSISDIVRPIKNKNDMVIFTKPDREKSTISYEEREEFIKLGGDQEDMVEREISETLRGRITRVDLDAIKNNLGFKVENKGVAIPTSFTQKPELEELGILLGRWIELTGIVTKTGEETKSIRIESYQIIPIPKQQPFDFEDSQEEK